MASATARPTAAAALYPSIETQSNASVTPVSSRASQPAPSSVAAAAIPGADFQVPKWLQEHMKLWKIPSTPVRAHAWVLEAFDHFNSKRALPEHFHGIRPQLHRAWLRENKEKAKAPITKKRKSDGTPNQPAPKRTKGSTTVKSENSQVAMPAPKPLGNLKGKYAIEAFYPCCDDESQRNHDEFCSIVLSPGDNGTLRGYLTLGRMNYTALMLFDKCPTDASTNKVPFRWRGKRVSNKFKIFRGDKNYGWAKFLGDGKIEISFDKLKLELKAQKGRGIGERGKHNAAAFWDDWHELDEESLDLLDVDRLIPW
ncbi:uncharacterized protein FSUBG_4077 [Fusarium subglutinans]|uniref:Uncharacterized protein n=1 Tax=Gibberella subglutinans TaxID=42677 RepID=A0A8H5Q6S2_GIBSU|nr:uncharacterized protein FSUBG_4077 [Fusarium subglutinans]KAF5609284.1 hypothetical protein FSUBG_4077 [Fusarium subglutinans]